MDQAEIRAHARRIIAWHNEDFEYCLVYEDDYLEDATDDEQLAIHAAMNAARIEVSWDD